MKQNNEENLSLQPELALSQGLTTKRAAAWEILEKDVKSQDRIWTVWTDNSYKQNRTEFMYFIDPDRGTLSETILYF